MNRANCYTSSSKSTYFISYPTIHQFSNLTGKTWRASLFKKKIRDCSSWPSVFFWWTQPAPPRLHHQQRRITFETSYSEIKHALIYWCSVFTRIWSMHCQKLLNLAPKVCDSPKTENPQAFNVKAIISHHPNDPIPRWMKKEMLPISKTE